MLIDLTQTYVNADDSPAITADTKRPVTLKFMLIQAVLSGVGPDGRPVPPDEKIKRYSLFRDLKKAEYTIELPAEDIAILKNAAKIFETLVMGQTHEMLERSAVKPLAYDVLPDPS
jgi:hypothetical protein